MLNENINSTWPLFFIFFIITVGFLCSTFDPLVEFCVLSVASITVVVSSMTVETPTGL